MKNGDFIRVLEYLVLYGPQPLGRFHCLLSFTESIIVLQVFTENWIVLHHKTDRFFLSIRCLCPCCRWILELLDGFAGYWICYPLVLFRYDKLQKGNLSEDEMSRSSMQNAAAKYVILEELEDQDDCTWSSYTVLSAFANFVSFLTTMLSCSLYVCIWRGECFVSS